MESVLIGWAPTTIQDDFTVATNEDWFRDWQLQHDGSPIAIGASWKLYMQLQGIRSNDLAMTNSTENQRLLIVDREAGIYGLRVRAADAEQVAPAQYNYDIVLVAGDGVYRLVKGTITVDQGITNVPGQEKWSHFPLILRP